ncbi:MAG: glycosyltransferase [Pseudomonadota bacterium]
MKICFFPAFTDRATLTDHFFRLHWYLRPLAGSIKTIEVPVSDPSLRPGDCPPFLDQSLKCLVGDLPVEFVSTNKTSLEDMIGNADVVLKWDVKGGHEKDYQAALNDKRSLRVDHQNVRYAGSMYLKFRAEFDDLLGRRGSNYLKASKEVYARIKDRCSSEICYVFGTGPGLAHANAHDFSDGVCIACNSMVKNTELLDRLQPPLIAIGDPIFHAGPSSYAAAFRQSLIEALDRYEADLIVPMRDYHIYIDHLPKRFLDRIAAVPFKHGKAPNHDLLSDFHVTTTGNILTLFLLPLAADFSNTIRIFGCDGRPLEQSDYFWGHDKASQFNEEMDDIQKAHPGFFDIDYNDYYLEHCRTLETWLSNLEADGKTITNHTRSFIPALADRSDKGAARYGFRTLEPAADDETDLVSIVMPAFNTEAFIGEAIESVRAQTYSNWELLIVEDGSDDRTLKIATDYASKDQRIRVFENPGKYQTAARNHAFENALGKYACFLDSDDIMYPDGLRARVKALQENKQVRLVHGVVCRIGENGRDLRSPIAKMSPVSFDDMHANPFHINGIMGDTELFLKHRVKYHIPSGEDWMMMARILRQGHASVFVPEEVSAWRYHPSSATQRGMEEHEAALEQTLNWVYSPCDPDDAIEKYRKGLAKPPLLDVKLKRKANVLMWQLLTNDLDGLRDLIGRPSLSAFWTKQSADFWANLARSSGLRFFRLPGGDLPDLDDAQLSEIAETLVSSGIPSKIPNLSYGVSRAFGLNAHQRRTTGSQNRPFLERSRADRVVIDECAVLQGLVGSGGASKPNVIALGHGAEAAAAPYKRKGWTTAHLGHFDAKADAAGTPQATGKIDIPSMSGARLKALVEDMDLPKITVLRLDALGHEHKVLRSIPWNRSAPDCVHCQFYDEGMSVDQLGVTDIAELLESRNYHVYISEWHAPRDGSDGPYSAWKKITPYVAGLDIPPYAWGSLMAFKDDPGFAAVKAVFGEQLKQSKRPKKTA